jgi:hypothetical protein
MPLSPLKENKDSITKKKTSWQQTKEVLKTKIIEYERNGIWKV